MHSVMLRRMNKLLQARENRCNCLACASTRTNIHSNRTFIATDFCLSQKLLKHVNWFETACNFPSTRCNCLFQTVARRQLQRKFVRLEPALNSLVFVEWLSVTRRMTTNDASSTFRITPIVSWYSCSAFMSFARKYAIGIRKWVANPTNTKHRSFVASFFSCTVPFSK